MAQGLRVPHISVFSKLLRDLNSDSLVRLNHYPPLITNNIHQLLIHDVHEDQNTDVSLISNDRARIFSKEVQILTILRSNDVGGLQISPQDGLWIPVSPHPNTSFSVFVGDTLQALTNGRFKSVRHRAMVNSCKTRMSMVYFGAPAPHARISCPSELVTPHKSYLYRPFTWAEYKKATYSRRLGDTRLQCFRVQSDNSDEIVSE
nr:gibberellin 2-beta-dioxygenase 2-like isoform X2 [Nicotiana tomentosiformis]